MKVGIIQSNYIPWRGYFDFIDDVDLFIFFDDVQYTRHDWRNRNRIKNANGVIWLTAPVLFSLDKPVLIKDAKIDYGKDWIKKHIETIKHSYSKAPFFRNYFDEFCEILHRRYETISQLKIVFLTLMLFALVIAGRILFYSTFIRVGL